MIQVVCACVLHRCVAQACRTGAFVLGTGKFLLLFASFFDPDRKIHFQRLISLAQLATANV